MLLRFGRHALNSTCDQQSLYSFAISSYPSFLFIFNNIKANINIRMKYKYEKLMIMRIIYPKCMHMNIIKWNFYLMISKCSKLISSRFGLQYFIFNFAMLIEILQDLIDLFWSRKVNINWGRWCCYREFLLPFLKILRVFHLHMYFFLSFFIFIIY